MARSNRSLSQPSRRSFLGAAAGLAGAACATPGEARPQTQGATTAAGRKGYPVLVGSENALKGMKEHYQQLSGGAEPLDVAISVVKHMEADPTDHSVGLGGLPNEDGVVQLDSAVMDGKTHNAGSVACIEDILHPCEVARLVMERTDHVMIVGRGAYEFARGHGHPHTELLTPEAREIWMHWRESMSDQDDRLVPAKDRRQASADSEAERAHLAYLDSFLEDRITGTIHCSALSTEGHVACTTTTSGLSWKIPGRVGDSPIIGAGLYCDAEAGSAGATGRGEAAILSHGSSAVIELLRGGASPVDAGLEVLRRVTRQAQRAAAWQPGLVDAAGVPTFGLQYYVLGLDGTAVGVTLKGGGKYAVADPEHGPRLMDLVALHEG
jgi:N4-(beta-N-acetylglucosaminyl)-L-asparaginase